VASLRLSVRLRALVLGAVGVIACDPSKEAGELAARASAQANSLSRDAKSATQAQLEKGVSAAKKALFGLSDTGALSDAASAWLKPNEAQEGTAEAWLARGTQVAPVAVEIARVANQAVDEETAIEPIYQKIEPGGEAKLDEAIAKMPRVELTNGTTVGFKKLEVIENTKIAKEQAVLVMWRRGDYLVGFLYRSKKTIDLEVVIKEAPRLIALTHRVIK